MPGMTVANVREMEAMVDKARVVGVTCLGITHAMFGKRKFDVCIVDEAGQITLPVRKEPMFIIRMNYHPEEKSGLQNFIFCICTKLAKCGGFFVLLRLQNLSI
jgi:hypothetical protein